MSDFLIRTRSIRRLVFIAGMPALSVLLNWPGLIDGNPNFTPAKVAALTIGLFALATVLWLAAKVVTSHRLAVVIALAWPMVDLSIGTVLNATDFSWTALASRVLGVWLGLHVYALFKSTIGPGERLRRQFARYVIRRGLVDPRHRRTLIRKSCFGLLILVAQVVVLVGLSIAMENSMGMSIKTMASINPALFYIVGPMFFAGVVAPVFGNMIWLVHHASKEYATDKPCFQCGMYCLSTAFDESGRGTCSECGCCLHLGQWIAPPCLSQGTLNESFWKREVLLREFWQVAAFAIAVVLLVPHFEHSSELVTPMFMIFTALFCLLAIKRMRTNLGRRYDQQDIECRECDYDLSGLPSRQGIGRCPECGVEWMKIDGVVESRSA